MQYVLRIDTLLTRIKAILMMIHQDWPGYLFVTLNRCSLFIHAG